MKASEYRLGYRADIEGLRAVAILLVVAAHAGVTWLAGGFVGVDVFFVLSGYLITGLLLQEIEKNGRLEFANFYARRLRRLLPALLVMLVCTCLASAALMAPGAQGDQAIAGAASSLWLSNIHFAFGKLDYFSPGAASDLFLHTWSLGVEEQFYLVWPALMVLALLGTANRTTRIKRLRLAMTIIAGTSLGVCIALTPSSPQMAFYMMPLRAWQFAVGALAWLYFNTSATSAAPRQQHPIAGASDYIGWLGLTLIFIAAFWFDKDGSYPGWRAMVPTVGAVAVIAAGVCPGRKGVFRSLDCRPLQLIGRISYSWYLWHWPVLILGGTVFANGGPIYRAILVGLSLIFAVLSYQGIESPIRHQVRWVSRPGFTVIGSLVLMVVSTLLCLNWSNASIAWAYIPSQQRYAAAHGDSPILYVLGCDDWFHSDTVNICSFGDKHAIHTAVLMGDSIGAQWFPAVAKVFGRPHWRLLVITKSACPMVDEPIFYPQIGRIYTECGTWRSNALTQISAMHPDIVMLGTVQTAQYNRAQWIKGTTRVLSKISSTTGHVYLFRGTPHLPFDGPNCLAMQSWQSWLLSFRGNCIAPAFDQHGDDIYQWLQLASKSFDNVSTLDLSEAICPHEQCAAERNGVIVYRDSQHLTASFVESLSDQLAQKIDAQLAKRLSTSSQTTRPTLP